MISLKAINEGVLLETYFEVVPFEIYVVDVQTYGIVYINAKMRQGPCASVDASLPCHLSLYQLPEPCPFCKIPRLIGPGGKSNLETIVSEMYDECRERWLQVSEKAINWPDGRIVKYAIAVDITETKVMQNSLAEAHAKMALMNKDLQRQNALLQENIRLREDVERMTRHDLKAPLGPIIQYPKLILQKDQGISPDTARKLSIISSAGTTMLNMINSTLDMHRLEQGVYVLRPRPCNLLDLLDSAKADLQPLLDQKQARFTLSVMGRNREIGDAICIHGEDLLCYSLFVNLLKNAVEASPPGGEVGVDVVDAGSMVFIYIENQGAVPPEIRGRFFDKYATAGKAGGTGLGAYIAKLIVQVHGGKIDLDTSQPDRTSLLIQLPAAGCMTD